MQCKVRYPGVYAKSFIIPSVYRNRPQLKTVKHELIACVTSSVDDELFLIQHEKCKYPKLPSAVDGGRLTISKVMKVMRCWFKIGYSIHSKKVKKSCKGVDDLHRGQGKQIRPSMRDWLLVLLMHGKSKSKEKKTPPCICVDAEGMVMRGFEIRIR